MWEPPIAYAGAVTGYLVESALYCEYKPLHDARSSRPLSPGEARRLTRRMLRVINDAGRRGEAYVKTLLLGEIDGVPVLVSPDAVYVKKGAPRGVLKSRIRGSLKHYEGDWASLILAGHILEQHYPGLQATLALILARSKESLMEALTHVKAFGVKPLNGEDWKVVTRIYDPGMLSHLANAIGVITGRRQPSPPPPSKCSRCPYMEQCPWSLSRGGQVME